MELEHYRQLEHLMRLARARARQNLAASHDELAQHISAPSNEDWFQLEQKVYVSIV
jgi:hypothetical protein